MFSLLTTAVTLALALNPVLAGVYTTNPVASTTGTGGQVLTVKWADDGNTPTLASIGPCSIDLYTGGKTQQTPLQNLGASVDVSKTAQISTTIDPSVGQSGKYYFVRFTSLGLADTAQPQYKYAAFSAIFEVDSMTGTFNSTVLAQIEGGAVAPSSSNPALAGTATSKSAAGTAKPASASSSSPSSAAFPISAPNALLAGLVGAATLLVL